MTEEYTKTGFKVGAIPLLSYLQPSKNLKT